MQFYYGTQMPLRVLDECEFWKQQEEEHTVVIRELVNGLESTYVNQLKEWEKVLLHTYQQVVQFIETVIRSNGVFSQALYRDLMQLVAVCLQQSKQFIDFLNGLMKKSEPIKNNPTAIVVIKHIIRESEYFIGIAQTILYIQNAKY
ncbi:DUF2935 domain-containing protein [Bacillus alveayuensis]|uniref:DUF2935 domain-containing protein n=1 Tax=Aeribacillus alveayuensis TaxID=279215 RepID=UPI0005D132C9|nr:DUF2935 domain-containing protein [Bacillus alveayuensis]